MIAGSRNRLNRNGRTAAWPSGPPRLNRTTAMRRPLGRWSRHWAPIRFRTCSTWAIGVSGRMPWPRLKMQGPCPQAPAAGRPARPAPAPPARSSSGSSAPWIGLIAWIRWPSSSGQAGVQRHGLDRRPRRHSARPGPPAPRGKPITGTVTPSRPQASTMPVCGSMTRRSNRSSRAGPRPSSRTSSAPGRRRRPACPDSRAVASTSTSSRASTFSGSA